VALFKKRNRHLGIDISASTIKLVELSRNGQRFQVEAIGIEPIPEGIMEDRNPSDPEEVGSVIKRALKASGSRLRNAAAAVPTSSVITRTIPMPTEFGEDEIETNIQIEASQYIPFPLEEIYLDFQIQGPSKTGTDTQDVMIVASRKENVDLREEALKEAGLKATIVDVEAYALENTFDFLTGEGSDDSVESTNILSKKDNSSERCTALIDIGANITALYVFQGSRVIFTREQSFGGEQLTMAIAETYGLPKDRAELAKRSGELSEDYPTSILEPFKQSMAEQIGQALQFFFASSHFNSVDRIILIGGGSMTPDLDKAVENCLGIPTKIGNPFEHMANSNRVNPRSMIRDAPLFAIACGLALRSFDS
jgi:type IV pilus assembly protein PilM